eukprot:gene53497-29578_t
MAVPDPWNGMCMGQGNSDVWLGKCPTDCRSYDSHMADCAPCRAELTKDHGQVEVRRLLKHFLDSKKTKVAGNTKRVGSRPKAEAAASSEKIGLGDSRLYGSDGT